MSVDVECGESPVRPPHRREWRVDAAPVNVPLLRGEIRAFAEAHGVPDQVMPDIVIAVTEAVTNAVLHAYVDQGEPGEVTMLALAGPDELVVSVIDEGRGMQPRADSPGLRMGLPTIGQLTTSVDIRQGLRGRGTEVRMRFAAPGVSGPVTAFSEGDERYRLLAEITEIVESAGWPNEAVRRLVEVLVPAVADACAIDVVDDEGAAHRLAVQGDLTAFDEAGPPSVDALRSGGALLLDVEPTGPDGLTHLITLPLMEAGRVLGLLHIGKVAARGRPDGDRIAFLETLAERAARGLAKKNLIEELRRTQRRFERILGALAEAITVHDQAGQTIYANEAAVRLMGAASAAEILAARPGEMADRFVITREDGSPVKVADLPGRRLVQGRTAEPLLTRSVERATGRARWLLTKATLLDDDGTFAVNIIEDVTEAKEAELRQRFLARAGAVLGATLDLDRTLHDIADLVAGTLADWCVVDVAEAGGGLRRIAVAHRDPAKLAAAREIEARYPSNDPPDAVVVALLGGGPAQLYPELTDEMLASRAVDDEHLRLLREVGMRSVMLLPMRIGARTIGVLTMISAESSRAFDADDLAFGEEVAGRAAAAVENARRFEERA